MKIEQIITMLMIALGVLGYVGSEKISGFSFDPLGSSSIPKGVSALLIITSVAVLMKSFMKHRNSIVSDSSINKEESIFSLDLLRPPLMLMLIVVYSIGVFNLRIPVSIMTTLFLCGASLLIADKDRKRVTILSLLIGIVLGSGIELVFTQFFFVDLPRFW
jgi:hypothetical protein